MKGIYFSENLTSAKKYAKNVAKREGLKIISVSLSKKQIPHIFGWKTYEYVWVKK